MQTHLKGKKKRFVPSRATEINGKTEKLPDEILGKRFLTDNENIKI